MRVDAYSKITQVYGTASKSKVSSTKREVTTDKVEISSFAKELQTAKKAVEESDDVRAEKVAQMKAKYNDNSYQLDPSDFADMLLRRFQEV